MGRGYGRVLAYGAAVGAELLAAIAALSIALCRRPRDDAVLSLGLLALFVAALTAWLAAVHTSDARSSDLWSLNWPLGLASLTAFVPFVWCVYVVWSTSDDSRLDPALFFLILTGMFAVNRYDTLVTSRAIHTVYLQPFVFPLFLAGLGVSGTRTAVRAERSLDQIDVVDRLRRLAGSATDLPSALRAALPLAGPLAGARAVRAELHEPGGARPRRFDWRASPEDSHHLDAAFERAIEGMTAVAGRAPPTVLGGLVEGHTIAVTPVFGAQADWGTLYFLCRAPPATVRSQRWLRELIGREMAELMRQLGRQRALREAAADERSRIARELHDSVSQTLYSIAMVADALPSALDRDPAIARDHARQIRAMTLSALGDTRVLLLEMRDSALESASLAGLLEQLSRSPAETIVIELDVRDELGPPDDVKLAAFRIAQEAVTNAHRHAAPDGITVRLEQRSGAVALSIEDDGGGFDPATAAWGRHGLQIMRERARDVGADLVIDSEPGRGTVVRFTWSGSSNRPGTPEDR